MPLSYRFRQSVTMNEDEGEKEYTVHYEELSIHLKYTTSSNSPNSLKRFFTELSKNEKLNEDYRRKVRMITMISNIVNYLYVTSTFWCLFQLEQNKTRELRHDRVLIEDDEYFKLLERNSDLTITFDKIEHEGIFFPTKAYF